MDSMKTAQGRGFPVMVFAVAMALTVNAAFGLALTRASTSGQRMFDAWNNSGDVMVADASGLSRRVCAKS